MAERLGFEPSLPFCVRSLRVDVSAICTGFCNMCVLSGELLNTDLRKSSPFPFSVERANAQRLSWRKREFCGSSAPNLVSPRLRAYRAVHKEKNISVGRARQGANGWRFTQICPCIVTRLLLIGWGTGGSSIGLFPSRPLERSRWRGGRCRVDDVGSRGS